MTNALTTIIENERVLTVGQTLDNIFQSLEKSAAMNVAAAAGNNDDYSAIEIRALVRAEMLNLSKGLDFAAIITKGRIVDEIQQEGLFTVHPAGYHTLEELAVDQGISVSELSQIMDLTRTIFPWIVMHLGRSAAQVFEAVGKSNMRELVPVLKRLITGETTGVGTVEEAVRRILDDMAATMRAAGQTPTPEAITTAAVEELLDVGTHLTNREVRRRIRPDATPPIEVVIMRGRNTEHAYLIAKVTDVQEQMVARRLHGYWDQTVIDATDGHTVRPAPATRRWLKTLFDAVDLD